ncbi:MAG: DNA methyltransferase [Methylococcaceae bacterium]
MEKLKLHSPDFTQANIAKLAELFPNCVTEIKAEGGRLKDEMGGDNSSLNLQPSSLRYAIDFDLLKQELSTAIVEGPQERYQLNWPGKREALLTANAPIAKTLKPCRAESVDFDTTQNLYIEGDNLDALKLLQETYLGKVKMIYIDPPYNTGNDFIYEDDFAENSEAYFERSNQKDEVGNRLVANNESNGRFHSDWLSMMYSRLKLARNLLKDDGVIFISIDDGEQANLKRLCDEVFGEINFIANIVWQKKQSPQNDATYLSDMHDHILVYAKIAKQTKNDAYGWDRILLPRSDEHNARYNNLDGDQRGDWASVDCTCNKTSVERPNLYYSIKNPITNQDIYPSTQRVWRYEKTSMEKLLLENRIFWGSAGGNFPRQKRFLSEVQDGVVPSTWWSREFASDNQAARKELRSIFNEDEGDFNTPKPTGLIRRMIQISAKNQDIILDFFSGSGTTAHAVMQLNAEDGGKRQFIMVQLSEACDPKSEAYKAGFQTIAEIGKERIRRAGQKIKAELERLKDEKGGENSSHSLQPSSLDIGFRVLKVDSSNMKDVYYTPDKLMQGDLDQFTDNIRDDSTPEDLLFQVLLDWGVDLTLPITMERMSGKDEGGRLKDGQKAELGRLKDEKGGENSSSSLQPSSFRKEFQVFFVDDNALAACFDADITEAFVKELAARHPMRVVFRDAGFASDSVKINIEQIFKLISPTTEIKTL